MGFIDILLWTLWIFVLVGFLFVLFRIFADIFRDHSLGGWGKAAWIIFIIVLPIIGALVYLIARGQEMQQRDLESAAQARQSQVEYTRQIMADADSGSGSSSPTTELANAQGLLESGAITQDEFNTIKAKVLAS